MKFTVGFWAECGYEGREREECPKILGLECLWKEVDGFWEQKGRKIRYHVCFET